MKKYLAFCLLVLTTSAHALPGDPAFFIGDPLSLHANSDAAVKEQFLGARLLFISTFALSNPDKNCSQIGWQFIYQDDSSQNGIRRSLRHLSNASGVCEYVADTNLHVNPDEYGLPGYQFIDSKLNKVTVSFEDANRKAALIAGNGFYPWWAQLVTPLHPKAAGRVFWNFKGPVICNKRTEVTIDAATGDFEPYFSTIPICP